MYWESLFENWKKFSISLLEEMSMLLGKVIRLHIFSQNIFLHLISTCYQSFKGQFRFLLLQNACCLLYLSETYNPQYSDLLSPGLLEIREGEECNLVEHPKRARVSDKSFPVVHTPWSPHKDSIYRQWYRTSIKESINQENRREWETSNLGSSFFSFKFLESGCFLGFREYILIIIF